MSLWHLAWRNLLRNRRRTLATLLGMVVGLVAVLLFGGYRSNIVHGLETGFVQYGGHLQVHRQGYFRDGGDDPLAWGIADYARLIDAIRRDSELAPMITVVTPTLQFSGIAGHGAESASRSVWALGLVADDQERMRRWNEHGMVEYSPPLALAGAAPDAAVVGTGVARRLRLCRVAGAPPCAAVAPSALAVATAVGATVGTSEDITALSAQAGGERPASGRIDLLVATRSGAPNVASLIVVGARNMGVKAIDDVYLALQLPQAQRLAYGAGTPAVTAVVVQLRHTHQVEAAGKRLRLLLQQRFAAQRLEVLDYQTLNPIYVQTGEFMDSMFGFIALLIGAIVLFSIGNTMSAAVVERTVEIGTLRAIGLRRGRVQRLFLCEAALLGVAGSALGLVLALACAAVINHSGWSWTPPGYSYAYLVQVRVWEDVSVLSGCVGGLLLVTLGSAWWPARRAAQLDVVDALRHA